MVKKVIALNYNVLSRRIFAFCCILLFSVTQSLRAEVVTDGSVGPAQSLSGPDYLVPDDIGTTVGQNLFHSFQAFSIFQGESATFTGPDHIANVISRVTGGNVSTIDGILRSQVGQADFFFINPAGIVFGENAQIDVPAAFHTSTADELRFADGAFFSASDPDASALSIAQPEAFGFLSPQPASIELNGAQLEFAEGSAVSLSSGDITIHGTEDEEGAGANLACEGGQISLAAMGDHSGEVPLDGEPSVKAGGRLYVESARITTKGNSGGNISVRAGEANLTDADLLANNTGESDAVGGVDIAVDGLMKLVDTWISSDTYSPGDAGSVIIDAGELQMRDGSWVSSDTCLRGDAGKVSIKAGELQMEGRSWVRSDTYSSGNAKRVIIKADELHMESGSHIGSDTNGPGNAGSVIIKAGELQMEGYSWVSSRTRSLGNAGSVIIHAGELQMEGCSSVSSEAYKSSKGRAGKVEVRVDGLLAMHTGALISSATKSLGDAGDVFIHAGELQMEGCWVKSDAYESSKGHAGKVEVSVDGLLAMHTGAFISSQALQTLPEDRLEGIPAHSIDINTHQLNLNQKSRITAESRGNVPAGAINVRADNLFVENSSSITTSSDNADAGPITLKGDNIILRDGQITTSAGKLSGNGGDIAIKGLDAGPANVLVLQGGFIQANAEASGASGGDIFIDTRAVIAEGGELQVGGQKVKLFQAGSGLNLIQAAAPGGEHGVIELTAPELDIAASLVDLPTGFADPIQLATDYCEAAGGEQAGSLAWFGRGGLPIEPDNPWVVPFGADRLDRLLRYHGDQAPEKTKKQDRSAD